MSESWNGPGNDSSFSGDQSYESRRSASPVRIDSALVDDNTNGHPYNHEPMDNHPPTRPSADSQSEQGGERSLSLFVSGLDVKVTDEQFHSLFGQYGTIESCSIMRDPHTHESRGFGFVAFSDVELATAAKNALQGSVIENKALQIEFARRNRPRTPTPGKYFGPSQQGRRDGGYGYRGGRGGYYDDRRTGGRPRYEDHGSRPSPYGRADYRDRAVRPDDGYRERLPQRPYAERGGYQGRSGGYGDRGEYDRKPYPDRAPYPERREYPERGGYDRRPEYVERRGPPYDYPERGYQERVYADRPPYPERSTYSERSASEYDRPPVGSRGGYNDRGGYGRSDRGDYRGSYHPSREGGAYRERYEERPPPSAGSAIPSGPSRGYGEYLPESRAPLPPVRSYGSEYRYERR
ncbi:hypothetical protein V1517DRAFT_150671 [Lipomyces orientalis]|uniref:Uncharacterized protein n=1 Tax=Lipomyces orientalis TaxID=1233043 RepID=A0ACC3TLN8_9ASCO